MRGSHTAAVSDGLVDKSRPLFKVGDDDAADGRLVVAAERSVSVGQDASKTDIQASQAVIETMGDDGRLSTPKCQPLDTAASVMTPMIHKSASK